MIGHKSGRSGVFLYDMGTRLSAARMIDVGGDQYADGWFHELYPALLRVASVSAPSDIDPRDLVQDALVRYLRLAEPSGVRSPQAFLTATIVNLASNHRRSWMRRNAAVGRLASGETSSDEYPSDLADLEHLRPRERAALYLHDVEGHPFDGVANLLGCSAAAARKAAERGRSRLALLIKEDSR